eukprot:TRINITY_DN4026_c5_g1_i1.p1 TRINITY_DN4026_c5_g1~~TRINITY_DN4026_c5_g1_i1.p1  ORF type:complete len:354 (+),score=34.47 TRINITY_DN4026_c5_g1_i1:67-1128(+)
MGSNAMDRSRQLELQFLYFIDSCQKEMASPVGRIRPQDLQRIPNGWEVDVSNSTGRLYYRNTETGETQWECPRIPTPNSTPRSESARSGVSMSSGLSYVSAASGCRMECICEICDCGKHHCPDHPVMLPYGDIKSVYRGDYPCHDIPAKSRRAASTPFIQSAFDPNHFQTIHKSTFIPHSVSQRSFRPSSAPIRRTKFTGRTTYQVEHGPKERTDGAMRKAPHVYPPKVPFDHKTTSQVVYGPTGGAERREAMKPQTRVLPNTTFYGTSTYNDNYVTPEDKDVVHRHTQRRMPPVNEDRDFLSTKAISYQHPPLSVCPAVGLPKKPVSRHTGHIHYHKKVQHDNGRVSTCYSP